MQTTPLVRWQRDIEQVRQLPPATDLRRLFFHRVDRLVRRDSTFPLKNRFFEAPSHLAGRRIEVRFDPLDLTQLEIYSEGQPEGVARLEFLAQHHGAGLVTGEVGAGKSTAARVFTATLNTNLYKILYVHFSSGSALDLLRQIALELDLEPAHFRGDLVRQIATAVVRLNQSKKQHPILICDEAHLLPHTALEQLPLLLNFDMDSSRYLTLLLVGQPLLRRTLSLQVHEALRQRIGVQYHLEGLTRDELDSYLAQQLKAAGVSQPLFDDTARQGMYQATKGIPRKVNKLAMTALRLAAAAKTQTVNEAILLDAAAEALL